MDPPGRGRLRPPSASPAQGEAEHDLAGGNGFVVRQVLSGALGEPVGYHQEHDEWALVVSGSAILEVGPEVMALGAGDWIWLPAGTPHRLVSTERGTSWVTVHGQSQEGQSSEDRSSEGQSSKR